MYVVEYYRHPVAWCFGQADVSRYYGFKDLGPEKPAEVGRNLLRQSGPVVIHCKQNPLDRERRIYRAAQAGERIEQFRDTLKGEELALNGDHHGVGRGKRIQSQDVKGWRTIDNNEVVFFPERLNNGSKTILSVIHRNKFDGGPYEVFV